MSMRIYVCVRGARGVSCWNCLLYVSYGCVSECLSEEERVICGCYIPRTIDVSHIIQAASSMFIHSISTSDKGSIGGNGQG